MTIPCCFCYLRFFNRRVLRSSLYGSAVLIEITDAGHFSVFVVFYDDGMTVQVIIREYAVQTHKPVFYRITRVIIGNFLLGITLFT